MALAQVCYDSISRMTDYVFQCSCGITVDISCDSMLDPRVPIRAHWTQPGATPPGVRSMNVSHSISIAPSGGSFQWPDLPPVPEPEPEPVDGPELRAVNGSVIGYRGWTIRDWELTGTGVNVKWTPGINEAKCRSYPTFTDHKAPDAGCGCGMYALARFDDTTAWWHDAHVIGAVEAWADADEHNHDRFFIHSTGFRAQYAKVILLAVSDEYPRAQNAAIRALAAEHGADVCHRSHLEDAAKEHGQLVPDEWLEWAKEDEPDSPSGIYLSGNFSSPIILGNFSSYMLGNPPASPTPGMWNAHFVSSKPPKGPKPPPGPQGICQTLGYPGPPAHGKYRKGNRVRDPKGRVYRCTRGGTPGTWELESVQLAAGDTPALRAPGDTVTVTETVTAT